MVSSEIEFKSFFQVFAKLAGPNERYDVAPIFWDGDVVYLHQDVHAALCQDGVRRPRLQGDWGVFLDLREDGQWCEHIIPEILISVIWSCIQGEVGVSGITFQEYDPKGCVKVVHLCFSVFFCLVAPVKTDTEKSQICWGHKSNRQDMPWSSDSINPYHEKCCGCATCSTINFQYHICFC